MMMAGDFNAVVDPSEKLGGRLPCYRAMIEFRDFIDHCGLRYAYPVPRPAAYLPI